MTEPIDREYAYGEEPVDFVDVHVTLDWVIRVHGTTDPEKGKDIATGYIEDQPLHELVGVIVHEDGVLCDGEDAMLDPDGDYLAEEELTVALYPLGESTGWAPLPTNVPVAVAGYDPDELTVRDIIEAQRRG